jgi:hypothetical protein
MRGFIPPQILIHSANASARQKMALAVERIDRFVQQQR